VVELTGKNPCGSHQGNFDEFLFCSLLFGVTMVKGSTLLLLSLFFLGFFFSVASRVQRARNLLKQSSQNLGQLDPFTNNNKKNAHKKKLIEISSTTN